MRPHVLLLWGVGLLMAADTGLGDEGPSRHHEAPARSQWELLQLQRAEDQTERQAEKERYCRQVEEEFRRYDQNGDALLNSDEMPRSLLAQLHTWDTNHDGLIDRKEFKTFYLAQLQRAGAPNGSGSEENRQESQAAHPTVTASSTPIQEDSDKPVVYRAGKLPKELPSWFLEVDTDHDGQIGLYEWKASGRSLEEFERLDRNDDGFLTIEEVLHAVIQAGHHTP